MVGDVHLHEACDPAVADDLARLVRGAPERACLVFNGDLFDLDRVRADSHAGLGPARAARRLARILARHSELEGALGQHVQRDGLLVFVAGNHDAELLLPAVRETLLQRLGGEPDRVVIVDKLQLRRIAIEHGHQTDPDAAFFPDMRGAVERQRLSALPLASLMTRLFVSHHPRYEAVGLHYETPLNVFLGVLRSYKFAGAWMAIAYPFVATRIAWQSVLGRLRGDVAPRGSALTMSSPWQVVRRLYLDRYLATVGVSALLGVLAGGWAGPGLWWLVGAMAAYIVVPPRSRRSKFGERDLRTTADEAERLAAAGARVVIFGHTHRAFLQTLGGAVYANHGAFSIPVEIDDQGMVRAGGKAAPRTVNRARKARPYLTLSVDPPACELRALRLEDE